jgi:NitT/TauT family transport system ATP-binding protein
VDRARVDLLLEETGLTEFAGSMPRELSGGMQQRASIVRALGQNPQVLLMDEPFGALDAFTRDEMNLLLLRLWEESGKTIVFVTHNISEAIFLADRVVVLTPRPGRLARIYDIELPRPRTIEMTFEPGFIELVQDMKRTVETGGHALLEVE